jgi:hypothetical protein
MADGRNDEQQTTVENTEMRTGGAELGTPAIQARRPYQPPRLRHLGSVRELTWGDTGTFTDGVDFQIR